ncbi:hypothetical protein I6N95_26515 [Vagococcus sp. BWB3-3]|uniref:Uncharacterized protein n=1 Tax=Vagococcus allomyrinae TaxID=2794353 RepID=A0A940PA48_9ENTE|nr:hypothetical protein [Vagococcus allomyrinae]MBP1044569.1 hypothetical protein [Vagococcus allomyrinae]
MLALQEALLLGKIADLESGNKVLLLDRGGAVFRHCPSGGWLREGFELTYSFISQITQIYDHQRNVIYTDSGFQKFISTFEEHLNDQPLFDDDEQICRECGCSYYNACVGPNGPCYWVEPDLCSPYV